MRLLHIDTGREMRGGQWQVFHLLQGLTAAGHDSVLMARSDAPLYRMAERERLQVRPLRLVALWAHSRNADVTHAHDARAHALAAVLGARRLVVSRRVAFPVRSNAASRWKYSRASSYVAVSNFVRARLIEAGIPSRKIAVVYDGVKLLNCRAPGARIVAPATEDPRKGSELLRQAAALAGIYVQFSVNLDEDLPGAGAFVYITREEGLGSAVLLAMSAGVPVVASRVGGLPEVIEDGRCGLLTENDPTAIAGSIRQLLDNPTLARDLAARGRERAQRDFSLQKMVEGTLKVYEQVLAW